MIPLGLMNPGLLESRRMRRMASMDEKVALVTGAASGIGKATSVGLAREGATVVLLVRNAERGEQALRDVRASVPNAKLEMLECDLASQSSIRAAAQRFLAGNDRLDVLVNAAGVFVKERKLTAEGIELTFATNFLAYFLLTHELLTLLRRSAPARVVNVASKYGRTKIDFDDLQKLRTPYSYLKSTPQSMLARVLFTQELAQRLEGTGVVANAVHPGLVAKTGLLQDIRGPFKWITDTFGGTPEKGADTVLWLATAPETATVTGKLFAKRTEIRTPGQGSDPGARKRLWDESEKLTHLA
jgi:NAD(P)-dependent dehydrogenase (short-subunit alcohol dehydrogenase family)